MISDVSLGQAHEAAITLRKAGATPEFWTKVAQNEELARRVVELVDQQQTFQLIATFDRDMLNEGWNLKEDIKTKDGEFYLPELVEFFCEEEGYVNGEEIVRRAKEKHACLSQRYAEALLRNQDAIPKEWQQYCLIFPGSVWQDLVGSLHVPHLGWNGARWCLAFNWLGHGFYLNGRLVRLRK